MISMKTFVMNSARGVHRLIDVLVCYPRPFPHIVYWTVVTGTVLIIVQHRIGRYRVLNRLIASWLLFEYFSKLGATTLTYIV